MVKSSAKGTSGIHPLFDYVLVKPLQQQQTTPSGIVLPDTAKEKPQIGQVMAVGPGAMNDDGKTLPMHVKVGQKVLYKKWGGNEVKIGNVEYLFAKFEDILAIES